MKIFKRYIPVLFAVCIVILIPGNLSAGDKRVYKVGILTERAPYTFVSWSKGGMKLRGAYIDVLSQVAHHMGVRFEYVKGKSFGHLIELFRENKVDLIGPTLGDDVPPGSNLKAVSVGLSLTSWLFINKSCKTIVCQKDLSGKRVAVIGHKKIGVWPYDTEKVPDPVAVGNPLEALTLLDRGEIHAFIAPSEEIASYIIQKRGFENVRRVGLALRKIPLSISFDRGNTDLAEKLARAAEKSKASGIIHRIEDKWYGVEFKQTFFEKYRRIVFSVLACIVVCLVFVITWNRQLKKQVAKITSRYKASEKRYRNLIETSADMMFVVNRQAQVFNMNREARFMFPNGDGRQDHLPDLMNMVFPADKKQMADFLESVFVTKRAVKEFRFKDAKIGYREIDVSATLLPAEPGEEQKACLFARDVTQRNRIERDLVQADRMAIIGQMAADVAHEINNPIGIVRANIDVILARGWFTPEAKEFLDSCKRNTVRAGQFTKDLLAMARPKEPEMTRLDLWELVNTTIGIMGAQLKNITIEKHTRGIPARILGDRNLLQQVLVNLFLNAAGAMKKSKAPRISITCCVPPDSDMARLRIEDTGVGIPREHLNEVFEPFFTQGKKEGFGLGLFISKRIIEKHSGVIYAESEVNIGTQFIIEIPLEDA